MPPIGRLGLSEGLRAFVAAAPYERSSILEFVMRAADSLSPGARVADVGAGDAPYRELFEHVEYVTVDWEGSPHEGALRADLTAKADDIPADDASFDAAILTQVLEHVPDPGSVLAELHRIVRPGGRLFLTVPLVWELHELPHDHFRYTGPGIEQLVRGAGFEQVEVEPRNDCFTTLAQLMINACHVMGRRPEDGLDERREQAGAALRELAHEVAAFAPLDAQRIFPLGYAVSATRPGL